MSIADKKHVRLRVAGLFYDEIFPLAELKALVGKVQFPGYTPTKVPTILELMEAAYAKPGKKAETFGYSVERRKIVEKGKPVKNILSVVSIAVELIDEVHPSLGDKTRAPGLYQLTELGIPNGVVAWQYYVYRAESPAAVPLSVSQYDPTTNSGYSPAEVGSNPKPGFTPFDQFPLEGGDEVIWRMVAIQRTPTQLQAKPKAKK